MQQRLPPRPAAHDERQPVGQAAPALRHRRRRARRARASPASTPAALMLEITETVMMTDTDLAVQRLQRAQGARRAAGDGRLRHRLLVAQLPEPLPGRHPQDGPLVPAPPARRRRPPALATAVVALGETLNLEVVAEGIELARAVARAARPRLRARPGLPLRAPDGRATRRSSTCARRQPQARSGARRCSIVTRRSTAPAGFSRVHLLAPLRHRDFRLLWSGMSVSLLGDGVFLVAMAWQVYALSNAPTALAIVGIAMTVPTIAFLLVGRRGQRPLRPAAGHAGRRRRARASPSACWRCCRSPARSSSGTSSSLVGGLRRRHRVLHPGVRRDRARRPAGRASSRRPTRSTSSCGRSRCGSAGPALGGVLIDVVGVGSAFALDAASFAVSARRAARDAPGAPRGPREAGGSIGARHPRRASRYIRRHVWLWGTFACGRGRLPAVHGPGRGAAARTSSRTTCTAAPRTSGSCSRPAASARWAARS